MRAVVYRGANDLRLETVPVPRIGANELLAKVAACGVCPNDIKRNPARHVHVSKNRYNCRLGDESEK